MLDTLTSAADTEGMGTGLTGPPPVSVITADQAGDCARFVTREDIVGEVFVTVWPPTHWGGH